jgi:hypothetical protein
MVEAPMGPQMQTNMGRTVPLLIDYRPVTEESGSESEDEESDGSDESILEASDSEGDEQLDNLGAFVESLASNRKKPEKQPDKEPSPLKESIDGNSQ